MAKRKKRLEKQYFGLLRQVKKHKQKLKQETGRKDTTHDYWKKEIEGFAKQAKERVKFLEKKKKK